MQLKYIFCLLLFLFLNNISWSQEIDIQSILELTEVEINNYKPNSKDAPSLYLKMSYGSPFITNKTDIKHLTDAKITSIDVLCTDHPKGRNFTHLTRKRLESLKEIHPNIFNNNEIKWQLVRQTNCPDKESAKRLFHGIVVQYVPIQINKSLTQSRAVIEEEIKYLKELFTTEETTSLLKYKAIEEDLNKDIFASKFEPTTKPYLFEKVTLNYRILDSTVFNTLNRQEWINMTIVADVTGSMSSYTGQLLMWIHFNTIDDKVKQFVFFNDGDSKADSEKIIGQTGGIYTTTSSKLRDVRTLAVQTMENGFGGDAPENNIEALLAAINLCPDCNNIVLIADNLAPIKDISLVGKITKKIKIILCGSESGINPQYLDLARATNGSIHTMNQDLVNLMDLKEGDTIIIGKQEFKIEEELFVLLKK
jgi:hypothetical protein